jgi:hypothetical protein
VLPQPINEGRVEVKWRLRMNRLNVASNLKRVHYVYIILEKVNAGEGVLFLPRETITTTVISCHPTTLTMLLKVRK